MLKCLSTPLLAMLCLACLVPGVSLADARFDFKDVARLAKQMADKPYQAPATIPAFMTKLGYDQYRQIRFQPERSLWHESGTNFQVMLVPPGENYRHAVQVNIIDGAGVHALGFHKHWFSWPEGLAAKVPDDLGYAGFKLTFPLDGPEVRNQFLVFAGASYFRGVARGERFGISARGIAVDTGLASGEEFPSFTRFWLVRPGPDAKAMKFYALLDGPSLTGAYQFVVYPGSPLRIRVHAKLFPRKDIQLLGLAPLTSMFWYGASTPRPLGTWRPAVHDSDGLLIHAGTGEWLWRPLINPLSLQSDYFKADSPKGFGLLQRADRFHAFEDAEARYDLRPSTWVAPDGDWGKGSVVLVQIPTRSEVNDNIVAFWSPAEKAGKGQSRELRYTLSFGAPDIPGEAMARAVATHVGRDDTGANKGKGYRIVVDFAGGPLAELKPDAKVIAWVTGIGGTKVVHHSVHALGSPDLWRLSMLVEPAQGKPLQLRAYLKQGDQTLSETWSYALPANNRLDPND